MDPEYVPHLLIPGLLFAPPGFDNLPQRDRAGGIPGALALAGLLQEPLAQPFERRSRQPLHCIALIHAQAASSRCVAAFCMRSLRRDIARVCTWDTRDSEMPSVRPISLSVRCS